MVYNTINIILFISIFFSQIDRKFLLPLIYLWIIVLWSNTSSHQYKNKTELVLLHTKNYEIKQLISSYLAAAIMFFTIGFGAIFRFALQEDWINITAILTATLFIPSLSLALGVVTKSSKLFEIVYSIMRYLGPYNKVYPFNFIGVQNDTKIVFMYLVLTLVFLIVSFCGRKLQRHTS